MASNAVKSPLFQRAVAVWRSRGVHRRFTTSVQHHSEKIVIPNRIPRSSTDILQALASTVGSDSSGPHYKYHDDPYLTPASNIDKRSYSLSKESGRKAARWILNTHGELFQHQPEDPVIEAFYPKITFNEESNVSEATLEDLIQKCFVSDAIQVYQICKSKGIELSEKIRQDLLEFVCYYNCEDPLDEDWVEERWYRQGVMGRGGIRKTWKDNGFAEELFQSLENKDSKAFCALFRGMSNYFQIDKAWQLYQEAQEKGIPLDTETYNSAIRIAPFLRESSDLRWQLMKDIMKTMADKGITPNLGTLNSTLEALVQAAGWRNTRDISLQTFSEFCSLGIKPSLATYYYLLLIHCRERGPVSNMLISILDQIEGKTFEIRDMKDTFFFVTAMDVCCNHLKNFTVARRVNEVLHTGDNYRLIGDSYKESIYHRHYFALACSSLSADEFMEIYHEMVPHIYTPEPRIMMEIMSSLKVHDGYRYLPQIWSDIIVFDHASQEKVVAEALSCTSSHQPTDDNTEITQQISGIAWDIWTRVQNQREDRRNKITWSGKMISDLLITLVQCNDYEKATQVFTEIADNQLSVLGSASPKALEVLSNAASQQNDSKIAVKIVIYAVDAGHQEAAELAKGVSSKLNLSQEQKAKITSALGIDIIDQGEEN
ncbi:small ribosomal subunit protein mS39 [Macrobrachium rosenbergii]|uniref:small ribosomal subunit protein mS39 n=1 Tax=Macrobrachium rosenbergii TaxID=79674 RepID=UPI0034D6D79D